MIESAASRETAVLVHIDFPDARHERDLKEFEDLVQSTGASVVAKIVGARVRAHPRYLIGPGKVEEIKTQVAHHQAELIVFDHDLSPSQARNLEQACQCRVLDRTGLILDIFAQRARSFEGKLQVELAQLNHLSTRLVRGWTHLERQRGGIGLRGPGETQLETDRRLIGGRIQKLNQRLVKVQRQREQGRRSRRKAQAPVVALIGYTNAGKSTLFNRLTGAAGYCADQLFATLDPMLRRVLLKDGSPIILADTVGFIRQLPHDLVEAFRTTLQEVREADLLLHVVDAQDERHERFITHVDQVLAQIGAEHVPQIQVYTKIDRTDAQVRLDRDPQGKVTRVWLSAQTGAGLELLLEALHEVLGRESLHGWLALPPQASRIRSRLFALDAVLQERIDSDGASRLEIKMPRHQFEQFAQREGLAPDALG